MTPASHHADTADATAASAGTITIGGDLVVHRMGFGAMRITGQGIFGEPADPDECRRVLRRAIALGVNFIDTADSYGPFVSEHLISETLRPYPADLVIATKAGLERPAPNKWTPNGRPEHLRRALDGSLERLGVDHIDLWQLHRIDNKVPEGEQFATLADALATGKVRHVGLSEVSVAEIERARQVVPISSVQNKYNVLDRKWDDVVDYCERESIAFIPWFPLGEGKVDDAQSAPRAALDAVAKRLGVTALQVALAWLLARSPVILPIPGTSKVAHLEQNVAAAAVDLSPDDLEQLNAR